jgi:hypothetical protein
LDRVQDLRNSYHKLWTQHIYTREARQDKTHYHYFTLESTETDTSLV